MAKPGIRESILAATGLLPPQVGEGQSQGLGSRGDPHDMLQASQYISGRAGHAPRGNDVEPARQDTSSGTIARAARQGEASDGLGVFAADVSATERLLMLAPGAGDRLGDRRGGAFPGYYLFGAVENSTDASSCCMQLDDNISDDGQPMTRAPQSPINCHTRVIKRLDPTNCRQCRTFGRQGCEDTRYGRIQVDVDR